MARLSSRHGPAMRSYCLPATSPAPHGGPRLLMMLGTGIVMLVEPPVRRQVEANAASVGFSLQQT